jgi:glycosyltransferase involved in cell wall biosynthesis
MNHREIFSAGEISSQIVAGMTDHPSPEDSDIIVAPDIASGRFPEWAYRVPDDDEEVVDRLYKSVTHILGHSPAIIHNTANSVKHNTPFGVASRMLADDRAKEQGAPTYLWVHDARIGTPEQFDRLLPSEKAVPLICVSQARKKEIIELFEQIAESQCVVRRTNEVIVIPNPVSEVFFGPDCPIPQTLAELAPRFQAFTRQEVLPQSYEAAEYSIFSDDSDVVRFMVPARIVRQKGIEQAIYTSTAYADRYKQMTILIVSGIVDSREPQNLDYWKWIQECILRANSSYFRPIFLGGVEWRYMPWLYSQSSLLFAPFWSEGFGLPPVEAALRGLPTVMSDDPAMMETTDGNALIIRGWSQMNRADDDQIKAARQIHSYLSSSKPKNHVDNLGEKAKKQFSSEAVRHQLLKILSV